MDRLGLALRLDYHLRDRPRLHILGPLLLICLKNYHEGADFPTDALGSARRHHAVAFAGSSTDDCAGLSVSDPEMPARSSLSRDIGTVCSPA